MTITTIINFKTYSQATGKNALKLAKAIEKTGKNIIVGVQATDISEISKKTGLKVYAQHVEHFSQGRNTGFVLPEAVKASGAAGVFLNHSEHKIKFEDIKKTIERCRKLKLRTAVFAPNLKEAKKIEKLNPDYLVIEPPELVAGKVSVAKAKPELIKKISQSLKIKFIVGAGIRTKEDVRIAMKLGASGIAVSSAVTKAKNPAKILKELIGVG